MFHLIFLLFRREFNFDFVGFWWWNAYLV